MKTLHNLTQCSGNIIFLILILVSIGQAEISSNLFKHHYIVTDLPGNKGYGFGIPGLADFDHDGDLDYAFSNPEENIYWYEKTDKEAWIQHKLEEIPILQLGGKVWDIDQDGWMDLITGGYWYCNSQKPRSEVFVRYQYDSSIGKGNEIHDMAIADVDGDGKEDLLVLGDTRGCFWYKVPADPKQNADWQRITITLSVLNDQDDIHGGFFPRGVGDLDKDGDADVVMPDRWYENQKQGVQWIKHNLPFGKRGPYGLSSRSWIVDLDGDQDQDIVIVDCDQAESRAAWLENTGGKVPDFTAHFLPLTAPGKRGSFHSLAVADFDLDGDQDILTVEQEDTGIFPSGADPRWYIWENQDGKGHDFIERVIYDGKLGGHDVQVGDVDGDGDLDICSKIWFRWEGNANGGKVHGDFMENLKK